MPRKNLIRIAFVTVVLLLVPLVAMQFTSQVVWTLSDFIVAGVLLFVTGLLIDLAIRKTGKYWIVTVAVILVAFLWLWAELGVGVFTNWGS